MEQGQLLEKRYQIIQELGSGSFGQTYLAKDKKKFDSVCVVKHLKPNNTDFSFLEVARYLFDGEGKVLNELEHSQIPKLLAFFEEDAEFYLVQEYVAGHPLGGELPPDAPVWTEDKTIQLLRDVLTVLSYVHGKGIIHRDIKPDNLMRRRTDNKIVLIDFGVAKLKQQLSEAQDTGNHQEKMVGSVGTYGYFPIEQEQGNPQPSSDLYALGMVAIEALTGINPKVLERDMSGEFVWQPINSVSPRLVEVLSNMVRFDHKHRYQTATDTLLALNAIQKKSAKNWKLIGMITLGLIVVILFGVRIILMSQSKIAKQVQPVEPIELKALQLALNRKDYREADDLTYQLMLQIAGPNSKEQGRFEMSEWEKFPCNDLKKIDQLWSEESGGKQGFSAQKQVLRESGNNTTLFLVRIAWQKDDVNLRGNDKWIVRLKYDTDARKMIYESDKNPNFKDPPRGHLPVKLGWQNPSLRDEGKDQRFGRITKCNL